MTLGKLFFKNSHLHSYIKRTYFFMVTDDVLFCSLCQAAASDKVVFCRCQKCACVSACVLVCTVCETESVCTIWLLNNMQCHLRHLSALLPMWCSEQGQCTANAAQQIHIWQPFIVTCHVTRSTSSTSFLTIMLIKSKVHEVSPDKFSYLIYWLWNGSDFC